MSYTLPSFLAHAIAMEKEAAARYLELAEMMESLPNKDVAKIFRHMYKLSKAHQVSVTKRAVNTDLPKLKSWQYRWVTPPEMGEQNAFDYMIEAHNALKYAHSNEIRAMVYYRSVAQQSEDSEVQRLAKEFADEESEHAKALGQWLDRIRRPSGNKGSSRGA